MARELTPQEVLASAEAYAVPVMEPESIEVVEAGGYFWLRFVTGGRVLGVTPLTPDQIIQTGEEIKQAGEIAAARLRKRRAGSN